MHHAASRRLRLAAGVIALVAGLTACARGGDAPAAPSPAGPAALTESAFAPGTCRLAAPDVLAVGRDATRLGDGGEVEPVVRDGLRESQDRLDALAQSAEPAVRPALTRLVVAIGLVRVRADGNTYEPALGEALVGAHDAVVTACTAARPASSSATPVPSPAG